MPDLEEKYRDLRQAVRQDTCISLTPIVGLQDVLFDRQMICINVRCDSAPTDLAPEPSF